MKKSRIVLALLALAALAATGFSTANNESAKTCCAADSSCCSAGSGCCGK